MVQKVQVEGMYVHLVKPPPRPDSKPTVRVKVKCNEYPTKKFVVKEEKDGHLLYNEGSPDDLSKNVKCMVIAETVGLWFMVATEILVWPNRKSTGISAFSFDNVDVKSMESSKHFDAMLED